MKKSDKKEYELDRTIEFEPEGNITESHIDKNGIIIVDKFEITGISAYCERKRKEKERINEND